MPKTEQEKRDYYKAYRKANREKLAVATKAWHEANPERVKAINRAYYIANREKILAAAKSRRDTTLSGTSGTTGKEN